MPNPSLRAAPAVAGALALSLLAAPGLASAADPIRPEIAPAAPLQPRGGPALDFTLTGTLDLTSDTCGAAESFAIPPGTDVRFCYFAHNVGTTVFELHDLADMGGVVFNDLPMTLAPGFAMWLMQNRQPVFAGSNLATWTATDGGGGNAASDSDSTAIAILPPVFGCNLSPATFSNGIPVGWTSYDWLALAALPDSDVDWAPLGPGGCGEVANYTGGRGGAACASSDLAGSQAYDTQLRSHSFSLAGVTSARLAFRVNYQDAAAGGDALAVDVSLDRGDTWESVAASNAADFGAYRGTPGADIVLDLDAWAGESDVRVGFRYVNHAGSAHDEYVQIDDVRLLCDGGIFFDGFESGDTHAWSAEVAI